MYASQKELLKELIEQRDSKNAFMAKIRDLVKIWTHSNLRPNA